MKKLVINKSDFTKIYCIAPTELFLRYMYRTTCTLHWKRSHNHRIELSKWTHNCSCSSYLHVGRFPFNQNIWFEFLATSNSKWNSIFQNFQKGGQPRKVFSNFRKLLPISFFSIEQFSPRISRIFG